MDDSHKGPKLGNVNFAMMHKDAIESLGALEQLMGNIRRLADFAGSYMAEDQMEEMMEEGDLQVIDDKSNFGKVETLEDVSDKTNVVDRAPKEMRKKMAVIKLSRL